MTFLIGHGPGPPNWTPPSGGGAVAVPPSSGGGGGGGGGALTTPPSTPTFPVPGPVLAPFPQPTQSTTAKAHFPTFPTTPPRPHEGPSLFASDGPSGSGLNSACCSVLPVAAGHDASAAQKR